MIVCPNTKEFKSWLNAGVSKKDIYTEYVLNNYSLPIYSENSGKTITFEEARNLVKEYNNFSVDGVKPIADLIHQDLEVTAAYFKDVLYFSEQVSQREISEEVGHRLLQRFADQKTYDTLINSGKQLLEARLKKEERTIENYLKQYEALDLKGNALRYAYEEEIMKEFNFFDVNNTFAQEARDIEKLTNKFSFLGEQANNIVSKIYKFFKALKNLLGFKSKTEKALELLQSYKNVGKAQFNRNYEEPSYLHIPKAGSIGVSPYAVQKIINDVVASYINNFKGDINRNKFEERITDIFKALNQKYFALYKANREDEVLMDFYFATNVFKNTESVNGEPSLYNQVLDQVAIELKRSKVKVDEYNTLEDDEIVEEAEALAAGTSQVPEKPAGTGTEIVVEIPDVAQNNQPGGGKRKGNGENS